MQFPVWTKPAIAGGACGALLMTFVGFNQLGWETSDGAARIARDRADAAVVVALLPQCLAKAQVDSQTATLARFQAEQSSYRRNDILESAGWATLGDSKFADPAMVRACAGKLYVTKAN